ncbi:unannotated protein [freshwater metagenome]|uniref:Unannotated protein n=1 Tax=freshwater metagenome TaxID=449393 RepID=A0A6J6KV75_9ZZZZ
MSTSRTVVLSESLETSDFVEYDVFTDVTKDGEIYTSYRIVRMTHAIIDDPDGWNYVANVVGIHEAVIGVAYLKVEDRMINDSLITLSPT